MRIVGKCLWATIILLALLSCRREDPVVAAARRFTLEQTAYGMYQNQREVMVFDETRHQLAWNTAQRMCRLQTDDLSMALQMSFDVEPVEGATGRVRVESQGLSGLQPDYAVKVLKYEPTARTLWLWCETRLIGFVVYYDQP